MPADGDGLCSQHRRQAERSGGLAHGLVTGPIPDPKLKEFQIRSLKTASRATVKEEPFRMKSEFRRPLLKVGSCTPEKTFRKKSEFRRPLLKASSVQPVFQLESDSSTADASSPAFAPNEVESPQGKPENAPCSEKVPGAHGSLTVTGSAHSVGGSSEKVGSSCGVLEKNVGSPLLLSTCSTSSASSLSPSSPDPPSPGPAVNPPMTAFRARSPTPCRRGKRRKKDASSSSSSSESGDSSTTSSSDENSKALPSRLRARIAARLFDKKGAVECRSVQDATKAIEIGLRESKLPISRVILRGIRRSKQARSTFMALGGVRMLLVWLRQFSPDGNHAGMNGAAEFIMEVFRLTGLLKGLSLPVLQQSGLAVAMRDACAGRPELKAAARRSLGKFLAAKTFAEKPGQAQDKMCPEKMCAEKTGAKEQPPVHATSGREAPIPDCGQPLVDPSLIACPSPSAVVHADAVGVPVGTPSCSKVSALIGGLANLLDGGDASCVAELLEGDTARYQLPASRGGANRAQGTAQDLKFSKEEDDTVRQLWILSKILARAANRTETEGMTEK